MNIAIEHSSTPSDPAAIYVITGEDSLDLGVVRSAFRRRRTEQAWTPIADLMQQTNPNIDPNCITINAQHPKTIYMGTWNDRGVYVSRNRGDSWETKNNVAGRVRKIIVYSRSVRDVGHTVLFAATDTGVYRSANSAHDWVQVLPGDVWSLVEVTDATGTPHFYAGVFQSGVWYADSDPTDPTQWTNLNEQGIGLPRHQFAVDDATPENFNAVLVDCCPVNPLCAYVWMTAPSGPYRRYYGPYSNQAVTVGLYSCSSPLENTWAFLGVPSWGSPTATPIGPGQYFTNFVFALAPNSPGNGTSTDLPFSEFRRQMGAMER